MLILRHLIHMVSKRRKYDIGDGMERVEAKFIVSLQEIHEYEIAQHPTDSEPRVREALLALAVQPFFSAPTTVLDEEP